MQSTQVVICVIKLYYLLKNILFLQTEVFMFQSKSLTMSEKGQGLVEYALILVLVAIVVIIVLMLLGPGIGDAFSTVNNSLSSVSG